VVATTESGSPAIPRNSVPDSPTFSVVIPTHNRAGIVGRALRSVAAQSFDDYEVIVVDDGSSDSTAAFLETVRSPRCRVLRNEHGLGASAARNRGVGAASGQWISFLDDDDEMRPQALAALHARSSSSPQLDFLWGGRLIHEMDNAGREISRREDDWSGVPSTVSGSSFLRLALRIATNSAFTIRRTVFQAVGGFDERLRLSEDRDLFIALAERGYQGAAVADTMVDIDERSASLSRGTSGRGGADIDLRVIDKHREYLYRPEHREFLDDYLLEVFAGFLLEGNRSAAMRVLADLRQRGALKYRVLRKYVRHAPEFRALKRLVRYDLVRQFAYHMRNPQAS
jgi:glycosyltransferase involved in cell wall biosynthesis